MATLTVQQSTVTGTTITFSAASGGGDEFTNDGRTVLFVNNEDASAIDVTIVTTQTVESDLDVEDRVVNVGAGTIESIGPFQTPIYSSTASVSYSATSNITVAAFKIS